MQVELDDFELSIISEALGSLILENAKDKATFEEFKDSTNGAMKLRTKIKLLTMGRRMMKR